MAGLTLAATLARASCDVTLFEAATHFEDIGAGIQLSPNATSVLDALGFDLSALPAMRPDVIEVHSFKGPRLMSLPIAQNAHAPYLHLHRADLIEFLVDTAQRAGVKMAMNSRGLIEKDKQGFSLKLGKQKQRFDLCIAADGVHSATARGAHLGKETRGTAWRAVIKASAVSDWARSTPSLIIGKARHIVTYPIRDGALINIVAVEDRIYDAKDGWDIKVPVDHLRTTFSDFGPQALDLLRNVTTTRRWALNTHIAVSYTHLTLPTIA